MQTSTWIRARQLDDWAKSPQAKALLPELIGRLVRATVPREDLKKCDFPAEAETHRPGYDGTTVTDKGTPYVPAGVAYWELGCDTNPGSKAQSDYSKRIEEHEERVQNGETDDISQAAFVAVTARDWHDKKAAKSKSIAKKKAKKTAPKKGMAGGRDVWEKAKADEKKFRTVKAYDSSMLEQWLIEAPAVALWLAKEMGATIDGVLSVGSYWLDVQAALKTPLPPEILLVNRAYVAEQFKSWLAGPPRELAVRAPSAVEVVAVFSAWVRTLSPFDADEILARTIVVEDRNAWRSLCTSLNPLILIAEPRLDADPELFASGVRQGHHVLRHANLRATLRAGVVELPRMRRFDLQELLQKAGLVEAEARQIASAAGGSFTVLRRIYGKSGDMQSPQWANDSDLASLLLAGAWEDVRDADREVIERLTRTTYTNARGVAAKWRVEIDPPLRLVTKERGDGKVWEFLSPLDSWQSLSHRISPDLVKTFEDIAVDVLSEEDPSLSLPPDERPMAAIKGLVRRFSNTLRQGIAEILAIGSTREGESELSKDLNFAQHARAVVRRVLSPGCGWQRWASLGGLLSSLLEGAPDDFLKAVEDDILSKDSQIVELMRQEIPPDGLNGAAYHSGLLWALETAAWPREHLPRVASILAQLTEKDPGGRWANRPRASAVNLFFSWRPQTVAPVGERIDVLTMLCDHWPVAAWDLITELIPDGHGESISDSAKPVYRDWAAGWTGEVSDADYFTFIDALADLALKLATADFQRWHELLDGVGGFYAVSKVAYEKVRKGFETLNIDGSSADSRTTLWRRLRQFVQKHTRFHKMQWALPANEVARWIAVQDRFAPGDAIIELSYLFADDGWESPDDSLTYEQKVACRAAERRVAIRSIWSAGGVEGIKRLVSESGRSWEIGRALAEEAVEEAYVKVIPGWLACGEEVLERLAGAFAAQCIQAQGLDWAESAPAAGWSPAQLAMWAVQMPLGSRVWDWVARKGDEVDRHYWQHVRCWGARNLNMAEVRQGFQSFLKVGRAWDALHFLFSREDILLVENAELLGDALEAVLQDNSRSHLSDMDAYYLREALSFLQQEQSGADEQRVARLEFSFLPLLDEHFLLPKTLQRYLARDPNFFVECLTILYRPQRGEDVPKDKGPEAEDKVTEREKQRAGQIWKLLRNWRIIPGSGPDGTVDPERLRNWVAEARKQAAAVSRLKVCDSYIGGVFARSPEDADGGIPIVAIREVIEQCRSDKMEGGFVIGLHNLRGVWSKGIHEGGQQERRLAGYFEKNADICARWPRTARALRSVAKDYFRDAEREDERANAQD